MFEINKSRGFSSEYDYSAFSVVRVHSKVLKKLGGRYTWVKISQGDACIYRLALGGKSSTGFTMESIEIDYDSCVELDALSNAEKDENGFYPCLFKIERAELFGKFIAHWKHPNPAYRVPMQLGIVSFSLGCIGFALGLMSHA